MIKFTVSMLCCKILERNRESQPSIDVPNMYDLSYFDIHNMYHVGSGISINL